MSHSIMLYFKIKRIVEAVGVFVLIGVCFSSCIDDVIEGNGFAVQQEETLALLKGEWVLPSNGSIGVMHFADDVTEAYDDLRLTFTEHEFTSENARGLLPETGTWSFFELEPDELTLDNGLEIEIERLFEDFLAITFYYDAEDITGANSTLPVGSYRINLFKAP